MQNKEKMCDYHTIYLLCRLTPMSPRFSHTFSPRYVINLICWYVGWTVGVISARESHMYNSNFLPRTWKLHVVQGRNINLWKVHLAIGWLKSLGLITRSARGLVRRDSGCLKGEAAMTVSSCSQLQEDRSTPVAQRFELRTFSTCMPQAGALVNLATSYSW